MKKIVLVSLLCLYSQLIYGEIKVTPIGHLDLLGGQCNVSGSAPAFFGPNCNLFFTPVINFSKDTALLPIYTGTYSTTKDVKELVGGGTLTREMQGYSMSLKFVTKLAPDLKLKTRAGYKIEYLKETKNETWGNGLFDYSKTIAGLETEKTWSLWNSRIGVDYYLMHYPNYQSLISKSEYQSSLDTTTYAELSTQAGKDVLDYSAVSTFLEVTRKLSPNVDFQMNYNFSLKNFKDQKIVNSSGQFSNSLRQDVIHNVMFGVNLGTPKVVFNLFDMMQYYDSNQNSHDVAKAQFTADYYDFIENSIMPDITFNLGSSNKPMKLSFFWDIALRSYTQRLAQKSDAEYKSEKIQQEINTMGVNFVYPLFSSVSAKISMNYRDSSSNMRYEKNYQYNYYTFNYFVGFSWEL